MLLWTIQWIFISLILIILLHYLYLFFKNTLTIPKVRDLVNKPVESYNEILDTIKSNHNDNNIYNNSSNNYNKDNSLNDNTMQDELKNFLNELKKPKTDIKNNNNYNNNFNSSNNNMFEAANDLSYSNAFSSY